MSSIAIRRATVDDVRLYYEWATDKEVRRQSFSDAEIAYGDHVDWYSRRLSDPDSHMFVLAENDIPVGQIRFTVTQQVAEIAYSVATEARGRGLACVIIERGVEEIAKTGVVTVVAKVKKDNRASRAAFVRCGFQEHETADCRVFTLNLGTSKSGSQASNKV